MRVRTLEDRTFRLPSELIEFGTSRVHTIDPETGIESQPEAVRAICAASVIILGPGPFFSSVLATLAAPRVAAAIVRSRAQIVLFANHHSEGVMTEGMALPCYARVLREHLERWGGSALGQLTVVAHGERATWSAIDAQTRLRRAPLWSGTEQSWMALVEVTENIVSGVLPKRVSVPIQVGALYEPVTLMRRRV